MDLVLGTLKAADTAIGVPVFLDSDTGFFAMIDIDFLRFDIHMTTVNIKDLARPIHEYVRRTRDFTHLR